MKRFLAKSMEQIRKQLNMDLVRRMRNGESLTTYDSKASWYPPRPIIEKDQEAIERLYSDPVAAKEERRKKAKKAAAEKSET